jgi:SAM-dependent methyltransferase
MEEAASSVAAEQIVVDVGAGDSPYAGLFDHTRYIAVDRTVRPSRDDTARVKVRADMSNLPFREACAHVVVSTQALEHVRSPAAALREMHRILAPAGVLFISVPLFDAEHEAPHDYWRFTGFGLRHLLEEAGFEVESIARRGGYFWVLNKQFRSVHEYLFPPLRRRWVKVLRYPIKVLSVVVFELCTPLLLYKLDRLDTSRHYTVGYLGVARKPPLSDRDAEQPHPTAREGYGRSLGSSRVHTDIPTQR